MTGVSREQWTCATSSPIGPLNLPFTKLYERRGITLWQIFQRQTDFAPVGTTSRITDLSRK